ncbi:MAG: hypothetical protein QM650_19290 [Microlunatus sp.]
MPTTAASGPSDEPASTHARSGSAAKVSAFERVSTVAFFAWLVGHVGELATVVTHGGAHADQTLFEHPVHVFFATIAVPSWMLSVFSSLVLLITAGVQAILRKVKH